MWFHTSLGFAPDLFYFQSFWPGTFTASTNINSNGSIKQCGRAILCAGLGVYILHELCTYSCLRKEREVRLRFYRFQRFLYCSLLAFSGPIPIQPSS